MLLRSCLVPLVLVACVLSCTSAAAIEVIRDPNAWDYAPLQYDDAVVRGVVTAVTESTVTSSDFWMAPPGMQLPVTRTRVLIVTLRALEALRGPQPSASWSFLSWQEDFLDAVTAYPIGEEMLICASIHPRLGIYYHSGKYGRYIRDGDSWRSGPTPRGSRVFADAILRGKIAEMSIEHVAEGAEVVFVGTIKSISETAVSGADGSSAEQLRLSFDVEQVRKGQLNGSSVSVVMLTSGMYLPPWRKHVPDRYEVGQRWLCFVKKNEVGWYPFAGSNGFLRVEASQLVYDNRVPFWHSKMAVDELLRSISEEGKQ